MIFLHFLLKTNFLSISNSYIYTACDFQSDMVPYCNLEMNGFNGPGWTLTARLGLAFYVVSVIWRFLNFIFRKSSVCWFFFQSIWYIVVLLPYSCFTFINVLSKWCFLRLKYQPIKIQGLVFWAQILYLVF